MNSVATLETRAGSLPATATEMRGHVQRIQEVMRAVMKEGTHFGKIPGAGDRMTLLKPGAEVLCATFHIAPKFNVEDLSDSDSVRYRVTCVGTHQASGVILGEGMGECSSNEEKYKWRRAYNREFDNTDIDRKRVKYGWDREKREEYEIKQIRTEPADIANTILKMACKRAQVAMSINVTAASDIFTQDLEDMSDEIRESVEGGSQQSRRSSKPATRAPAKAQQKQSGVITESQLKLLRTKMEQAGMDDVILCERFSVQTVEQLPFDQMNAALAFIKDPERDAIESEANGRAD